MATCIVNREWIGLACSPYIKHTDDDNTAASAASAAAADLENCLQIGCQLEVVASQCRTTVSLANSDEAATSVARNSTNSPFKFLRRHAIGLCPPGDAEGQRYRCQNRSRDMLIMLNEPAVRCKSESWPAAELTHANTTRLDSPPASNGRTRRRNITNAIRRHDT